MKKLYHQGDDAIIAKERERERALLEPGHKLDISELGTEENPPPPPPRLRFSFPSWIDSALLPCF